MKQISTIFFIIFSLAFAGKASAQLYINATQVYTQPEALVYVDGDVVYAGNHYEAIDHYGLLEFKGNWYNLSVDDFKAFSTYSSGTVLLSGGLQTFNGLLTRFPVLSLSGTSKKVQNAYVEVSELLDLSDRELDVNGYKVTVLNSDPASVRFDGGYVNTSGSSAGWLVRNMTAATKYVFPLGNVGSQYRFRPLVMSSQNDGFVLGQFQQYDPANDRYSTLLKDQDIEKINTQYYHAVMSVEDSNRIAIEDRFSTRMDGDYNELVYWNSVAGKWQSMSSTYSMAGTQFPETDMMMTSLSMWISNEGKIPVNLATKKTEDFFIPNVITPNADGKNDQWVITGLTRFKKAEVNIFNRWGSEVYHSNNYDNRWDGKGLNAGTYYYVLKLTQQDGSVKDYKGWIEIIRK